MKYRVYMISEKFHKIMTTDLLTILLEKETSLFANEQMRLVINNILYSDLFEKAASYFRFRDDILISNFNIDANSAFLQHSALYLDRGELIFEKSDNYSPITDFLYAYYPTFLLVPVS